MMAILFAVFKARQLSGLCFLLFAFARLQAQSCTNLCLQQVTCSAGQTTSISGVVYAPNGVDPLPNVVVYIPNAAVQPLSQGVSCPAPNTPPSGSPLVGTVTAVDGSFTLTNVPVGANIPLVIQSGKWRRQFTVPGTVACSNTAFNASFPQNSSQGDIPRIAIATASSDAVECVLTKVGISNSEFTNAADGGRVNFFQADGSPGAYINSATPPIDSLVGNATTPSTLSNYDVLMLPCEGQPTAYQAYSQIDTQRQNIVQYLNAGGKLYTSHRGYNWLDYTSSPFLGVVNWAPETDDVFDPDPGPATINTTFSSGETLAGWLALPSINAESGPDQVTIAVLRQDTLGVNPPTQAWLNLDSPANNNPVMQFTFDTPVGQSVGQCGRVLFNDYHVEDEAAATTNLQWPTECSLTDTTTAQEKLLEYSLFDLTSVGAPATLTPATQDFGDAPVGFNSANVLHFTWTNNAVFGSYVSSVSATGDFSAAITGNCNAVPANGTCDIAVTFKPSALGARTGVLTVNSPGLTLTSTLTGTGTADLSIAPSLAFPLTDVTTTATQTLTLTNLANGPVPLTPLSTTGNFTATSACASVIAANATCAITVSFTPATTGPLSGTLAVTPPSPYIAVGVALTGTGVDFSITASPTSGTVIAGDGVSFHVTTDPIAGFDRTLTLTCTTNAPASTCTPQTPTYSGATAATSNIVITTTAQYAVIGYTSLASRGIFLLFTLSTACWLCIGRRRSSTLQRLMVIAFLGIAAIGLTGCSGHLPAENPSYTPPGSYTYTVTASDGQISHSATYTLTVTQK